MHNGDDPPLTFESARVQRLVYRLALQATALPCRLALGNPRASALQQDFAQFADKLRAEGVAAARLGPIEPNAAFRSTQVEAPWSERHQILIWIALLAVAAALGYLVYQQLRMAPGGDAGTQDGGRA